MNKYRTIVRPLQQIDIEAMVTTFTFPWSSTQATREKLTQYYQEQQQNIRTVYVLLEAQGLVVGYGSLLYQSPYPHFNSAHIPEINDVWISKEHRKQGYGEMLIAALEQCARDKGYAKIGLGVGLYADYGPAQRLYIKLGYIPDGHGVSYKNQSVNPGQQYTVDDNLILWLSKLL